MEGVNNDKGERISENNRNNIYVKKDCKSV